MKKNLSIFLLLVFLPVFAQKETSGTFKTEIVKKVELGFALHVPSDTKSKKPLIVFLHGSGEKGTDVELVKVHGPFKYMKANVIDAYVLAPQCRENEFWDNESLYRLIQKVIKDNHIDTNRVYLTGLSLGGWGTWNLAFAHPEMFAAIAPICGFIDRLQMDEVCKIKDIPTRIFHGLLDDVVDPQSVIDAYKELKKCNANVSFTIFDDANHDSWTRVYDNPEIYQWMLAQTKK